MKSVLITGAAGGIGQELVKIFLANDYIVFAGCRQLLDSHISQNNLHYLQLDVTNQADIKNVIEYILDKTNNLDCLINNAGIFLDNANNMVDTLELDTSLFSKTFEVNCIGAFNLVKNILPIMQKNNYGRIINISSGYGVLGEITLDGFFYKSSKLALNALTIAVAKKLANYNVTINSVCPGWVKTKMGGENATKSPIEAAANIFWVANLSSDYNGKFFRNKKEISFY